MKDQAGAGFCPAKQKTERDALGIGRAWIPMVRVVYRDYGVRKMQRW